MPINKLFIIITTGDPAGIGPEVTRKALKNPVLKNKANFLIIGELFSSKAILGKPSARAGEIAYSNIKKAVNVLKILNGRKALVTAPISKYSLKLAGYDAMGHTEILSRLTGSKDVAMMFCADRLRLVLVTRHIPLSKVDKVLSIDKIFKTTVLFYKILKTKFRIKNPKIGIAGLNPHAGEEGIMGTEERRIIMPAVARLKRVINNVSMRPADVLFKDLYNGQIDGIVCMYHDQGLAPFKMLYFDKGVNITLGLPFIRTSPDHGTAFDIAGKGKANPSSMIEAIKLAIKLA